MTTRASRRGQTPGPDAGPLVHDDVIHRHESGRANAKDQYGILWNYTRKAG